MTYFLLTYLLSAGIQLVFYRWLSTSQGDIPPTLNTKAEKIKYLRLSMIPVLNTIMAILGFGAFIWFYAKIIKIHYDCFIIREKGKIDADFIKKYGTGAYLKKQGKELDYFKRLTEKKI